MPTTATWKLTSWPSTVRPQPSGRPSDSARFDALHPPRVPHVIRIRDRLYGARHQAPQCMADVVDGFLQTRLRLWAKETERAESFLDSEARKTQAFGRERPNMRSIIPSLQDIESLLPKRS